MLRGAGKELLSLTRFRSSKEIAQLEGESDVELRDKLWAALNAVEPGFLGLVEVFPADKNVIYAVAPEEALLHYRRSYTDDGEIALSDERTEVEPVTEWKPVNAAAKDAAATCGCGATTTATNNNSAASAQGDVMHKHDERITALIANPRTPWKEQDRKYLQTVEDERLREIEADAKKREEESALAEEARRKQQETAQPAASGTQAPPQSTAVAAARSISPARSATTEEDPDAWKATAPQHVLDLLARQEEQAATRRKEMLKALGAKLKGKPLAAKLESKTDAELEDLMATVAAVEPVKESRQLPVDFGARALAGQRQDAAEAEADENTVPPAPKVSDLIRSQRAQGNKGAAVQ